MAVTYIKMQREALNDGTLMKCQGGWSRRQARIEVQVCRGPTSMSSKGEGNSWIDKQAK